MKKMIQKIIDFVKSLFAKKKSSYRFNVVVEDETSLRGILSQFDDVKIDLADDIQLTGILRIEGKRVMIDGHCHTISAPMGEHAAFAYPMDYDSGWLKTSSEVEVKKGEEWLPANDPSLPYNLYRVKLADADHLIDSISYTHVVLSIAWTTYTFRMDKIEAGYVYFWGIPGDYAPNQDHNRYGICSRVRLVASSQESYDNYAITICDGADVSLHDVEIIGGINIGESKLKMYECCLSNAGEYGVLALDSDVDVTDCQFQNTWRSAIYCYGGYLKVDSSKFAWCAESMSNYACIQTSGQYKIVDNVLNRFGSFGIRVGCGRAHMMSDYICEEVIGNSLDNGSEQGVVIDTGAIYVSPNNHNCIVKGNRIENYRGTRHNHGIYLDDGAYNVGVEDNNIEVQTGYAISARYEYVASRGYAKELTSTSKKVLRNICRGGGIWYRASEDGSVPEGCAYNGNLVGYTDKYRSTNKLKPTDND